MLNYKMLLFLIVKLYLEKQKFKENIKNNLVELDNMEMYSLDLNTLIMTLNL